ncbi:DNA helicase UvrD [Candidatus Woesearchaeota archaeon]|nr:DNA helicase UvrD [Candidatus Woesearchaeota archaeon]
MIIADLHIHSKYSRACSTSLDIDNLEKWARVKGVGLLGTGDFCHPKWIVELKEKLTEDGSGVLKTKSSFPFILQNEISLIYTQGGKGRRVHLVILAPSFEVVDKITAYLKSKGRIDYDGRPIFNISCEEFTRQLKAISEDVEIIPAHAWTPWFGIFGSKTGFNSLEEAFGPMRKHIHAIESGLSSDPEMNRRLSKLDDVRILSFSDSHSFWPWRLGREATIFELEELTYENLIAAIRTGKGLKGTIEVDPGYGKYHYDGHRDCEVSMSPEVSSKVNKTCPVCDRPLTIGVLNRVEELADRSETEGRRIADKDDKSYKLIPLHELIAAVLDTGMATKKAWTEYYDILKAGKDEYDVLLNVSEEELLKVTSKELAELIMMNRKGELEVKPGYDGEYGKLVIGGKEVATSEEDEKEKTPRERKERQAKEDKSEEAKEKPRAKTPPPQKGLGEYF